MKTLDIIFILDETGQAKDIGLVIDGENETFFSYLENKVISLPPDDLTNIKVGDNIAEETSMLLLMEGIKADKDESPRANDTLIARMMISAIGVMAKRAGVNPQDPFFPKDLNAGAQPTEEVTPSGYI